MAKLWDPSTVNLGPVKGVPSMENYQVAPQHPPGLGPGPTFTTRHLPMLVGMAHVPPHEVEVQELCCEVKLPAKRAGIHWLHLKQTRGGKKYKLGGIWDQF